MPRSPSGPVAAKWDRHKFEMKLVNPANKRKFTIIVVGTGLAGASAAASLGELGYNVMNFCIQDSPRRAHSIAAQGGINAAKNYQNDGDSVYRLFYDTVKGGDYRSREANVYRLAQLSVNIIDQCVAQGVPFAREYGGLLDNRSFGGAQVSRTFYARGPDRSAAAARRLSVADAASPPGKRATVRRAAKCSTSSSSTARRAASSTRDLVTGKIERYAGDAVILATGGYGTAYYLSTNAVEFERHGGLARTQARRALRESLLHADPSDLHSRQRRPSIEAHAHEREPAQRRPRLGAQEAGRHASAGADPRRASATTTSSGSIRASGTSFPATSPRAMPSRSATTGEASATAGWPSTSISRTPFSGSDPRSSTRNAATSSTCTRRSPTRTRTRSRCESIPPSTTRWAGLWVDYNLMSTVPGLHVLGRGELLGPRREPPRRERADARAWPTATSSFLHDRPLPCQHSAAESDNRARRLHGSGRVCSDSASTRFCRSRASWHSGNPSRARPHHVGRRRNGPHGSRV